MTRPSPVELVPAKPWHVGPIATRMRAADRDECLALGFDPKPALRRSLQASSIALTALIDGRPEAMMGIEIRSAVEGLGAPWMLSTDAAYASGRAMLRLGPVVVDVLGDSMRRLTGIVGAGNDRAIRMLRRWGFEVEDTVQMIGGHAFVTFGMIR